MTRTQAIKTIEAALADELRRLAFGANIYQAGYRDPWARRDYERQKRIMAALDVLRQGGFSDNE